MHRDLLEPNAPAWENGLRIEFVPVSAQVRISSIISDAVDLECGSTAATDERRRVVAFSPVFFLAGTKLSAGSDVQSYRDLAGGRIAVSAGTTNASVMHRLAVAVSPQFSLIETPSVDAAYDMLALGNVQAAASDDIFLAGMVATHPGERFSVNGDYLCFEPYTKSLSA